MAKYTELFAEYLESDGKFLIAVVTSKYDAKHDYKINLYMAV